jgi:hypothetical protein
MQTQDDDWGNGAAIPGVGGIPVTATGPAVPGPSGSGYAQVQKPLVGKPIFRRTTKPTTRKWK